MLFSVGMDWFILLVDCFSGGGGGGGFNEVIECFRDVIEGSVLFGDGFVSSTRCVSLFCRCFANGTVFGTHGLLPGIDVDLP